MTLNKKQKTDLEDAIDKVTIDKIKKLKHGSEIELNDSFVLYHYFDEDVIVLNLKKEWVEFYQILTDGKKIILESLN